MKKILYLLTLPMLMACGDYITEEERYIPLEDIECKRNILIEDFTGQLCSNCPDAHQVINDLGQQYGDHVIAVAIHAGHFGIAEGSNANIVGLMQPEGNAYADYWGVSAYPAGIINRTSGVLKHTEWAAYARQELTKESPMSISLTAAIIDDNICIHTEILPQDYCSGLLQLWVTESNITAMQQYGGSLIPNYQHHHVYRASVNGMWGEEISLTADEPATYEHSIAIRDHWDTSNLSVIAFVYKESEGVLQVAEQHINK